MLKLKVKNMWHHRSTDIAVTVEALLKLVTCKNFNNSAGNPDYKRLKEIALCRTAYLLRDILLI